MNVFQRILSNRSDAKEIAYRRGRAYMKRERWHDAERELSEGLRAHPDDVSLRFALGFVYIKQGRLDAAVEVYKGVLDLNPQLARAHYNLALAYQQKGNLYSAVREAEHALALGLEPARRLVAELVTSIYPDGARQSREASRPDQRNGNAQALRVQVNQVYFPAARKNGGAPRKTRAYDGIMGADLVGLYNEGWRDFRGLKLSHIDLRDADLQGSDFGGADLVNANLIGANLIDASFAGANLYRAFLQRAILYGAKLDGAVLKLANLSGADLREATLIGADLSGSNLYGAWVAGDQLAEAASILGADMPNGSDRQSRS